MLRGPPAAHSTGSPSRRQHKSCRPRRLMSDLDGFPTRIAMKPAFGTLEWSKKNNGVLTRTEQFHFLRNMAFLAAREVTDVIRAKLGLLKPLTSTSLIWPRRTREWYTTRKCILVRQFCTISGSQSRESLR